MTRKKRKTKDQSKDTQEATDTNSGNRHAELPAKKSVNTEDVEAPVSGSKKRLTSRQNSASPNTSKSEPPIRDSRNSDLLDGTGGVSTRRSMRRPASADIDSSIAVPPFKKMKKNDTVRGKERKITSSGIVKDNTSSPRRGNEVIGKSVGSESYHMVDVLNEDSVVQENHTRYRVDDRNEISRKRRLADVNDKSIKLDFNDRTTPQKSKISNSKRESGSEVVEEKLKDKRRRLNFYNEKESKDENHTKLAEEVENDGAVVKGCYCPTPTDSYLQTVLNSQESMENREWQDWHETISDVKGDPLINRKWSASQTAKSPDHDCCFSILTYNILAESLLKKSHYFQNISPAHWNQTNRHKLIMKELKALDADAFCLQEVEKDYMAKFLSTDLSSFGYEVFYASSEQRGSTEGVAICYRTTRFQEVARKVIPLSTVADSLIDELNIPNIHKKIIRDYFQEPQMLQCIILRCRKTGKEVCMANAHISYAKHKKPDLQCVQVARGIWHILSFISSVCELENNVVHNIPFVFCGDLNSNPSSAAYQLCRDGYLNDTMLNSLQMCQNIRFPHIEKSYALVNILWKAFQHPSDDIRSCYYEILNREPPLTINLKGNSGCVDYVWYANKGLSVEGVLLPRSSAIRELEDSLPNADFPSDHLSLSARLSFK